MTATANPHRLWPSRTIKRLSHRSPPIHDDRVVLLVPHTDTPDVEGGSAGASLARASPAIASRSSIASHVNTPEAERPVAQLHPPQSALHTLFNHISLIARLMRAALPRLHSRAKLLSRPLRSLQAGKSVVYVSLFLLQVVRNYMAGHAAWSGHALISCYLGIQAVVS